MSVLPQAAPRWEAVVFDLDGTLADTRPGIRGALAATLTEVTGSDEGIKTADLSSPLDDLIRSAAPTASDSLRQQLAAAYRRHYDATYWQVADAYPGAGECLSDLAEAGVRLFVVTNKRMNVSKRLLDHLGLARYFEDIVGQAESGDPVTKAVLMTTCLQNAGLNPASTVVVGDSDHDADMAAACHTPLILVTYGVGKPCRTPADTETHTAGSLAEVTKLVLQRLGGGTNEP